ncbi:MAG: DUF3786 domain-containing protein [Deltaproteobacteria bacterium]|nr:DUF3786 domain-containing protein [Deltaproteobacteria bacterium]
MEHAPVFERIYQEYIGKISPLDLHIIKDRLGLKLDKDGAIIPFYGIPYRVSKQGIVDANGRRPSHSVSVVLCKYLLMCPENEPKGSDWVTYKDFKDAAPFVGGFLNTAEKPISRTLGGRMSELERLSMELSGRPADIEISCDLAVRFEALPRVPLLMLFNDRDEDFPAQCSLLFERRAEHYLDMECLAMVGIILAARLTRSSN